MQKIQFTINLSAEKMMRYYRGDAQNIVVTALDGRRIQISAENFRPFVTQQGIYGHFELQIDQNNKFIDLKKCSDA